MGKQDELIQRYAAAWRSLETKYRRLSNADRDAWLDLDELHGRAAMLLVSGFGKGIGPAPPDTGDDGSGAYRAIVERERATGQYYTHLFGWQPVFGAKDPPPPPPVELLAIRKQWKSYVYALIGDHPDMFSRDAVARLEVKELQLPDTQAAIAAGRQAGGMIPLEAMTPADQQRVIQHLDDCPRRAAVVFADVCEHTAEMIGEVYKQRWSKPMTYEAMAASLGGLDYRTVKKAYGNHIEPGSRKLHKIDLNHVPEEYRDNFTAE